MSSEKGTSDPDWAMRYRGTKDVPWYLDNIDDKVTPEIRALLEDYSHIPPPDVLHHVAVIRDKAWAIRSYPCTGLGLWLNPMIPKTPAYEQIIQHLRDGSSFLDVGAFLGQDLRRLVADGAPSEKLYAVDIVSHWDIGFEMFRDRDRFSAHFIEADILFPNAELCALSGKIDIILITHVLHQWAWEDQVKCLLQLVKLSSGPGAMVVGFQVGSAGVREIPATELARSDAYWHSPESFQEMWEQVGSETGTKWTSKASLLTWEEIGWNPKDTEYLGSDARVIRFVVERTQ